MFLLLLLIIAMFISPYILIPVFAFFALLVLLLPFQFTVNSLFHIFTIPGQIYKIAANKVLRMNHALEHATVNILERKYGYKNLAGYAENNGFFIIGTTNIFHVEQAAREGLALMKRGEKELAIHSKCGTSISMVNFISSLAFIFLILVTGHFNIMNVLLAVLFANLLGPLLGRFVQRYFTTSADVSEMEIVTSYYAPGQMWNTPGKIFIKTSWIPYL